MSALSRHLLSCTSAKRQVQPDYWQHAVRAKHTSDRAGLSNQYRCLTWLRLAYFRRLPLRSIGLMIDSACCKHSSKCIASPMTSICANSRLSTSLRSVSARKTPHHAAPRRAVPHATAPALHCDCAQIEKISSLSAAPTMPHLLGDDLRGRLHAVIRRLFETGLLIPRSDAGSSPGARDCGSSSKRFHD